jgi:hypothetical protein
VGGKVVYNGAKWGKVGQKFTFCHPFVVLVGDG